MNVPITLVKHYCNQILRPLFWLLKLSQSHIGKNVSLNFPIQI
jgi:hypothetical protein